MNEYICENCGKKIQRFPSQIKDSIYCSVNCYNEAQTGLIRPDKRKRIEVECLYCKKMFEKRPCEIKKYNFCSTDCSRTWQREVVLRGKDNPQFTSVLISCGFCSEKFYRQPSHIRGNSYCSNKCAAMANALIPRPSTKVKKNCSWCGAELFLVPSLIKEYNFCSYDCRGYWYSENYSGGNSPQYIDGQARARPRGIGWKRISEAVKERDGECVKCGSVDSLVVHHILARRYWKTVEESNQPSNLITLCDSCHGTITGNKDIFPSDGSWDNVIKYVNDLQISNRKKELVSGRSERRKECSCVRGMR